MCNALWTLSTSLFPPPPPQLQRGRQPTTQAVEAAEEISKIFIQAGIHLDAVNDDGLTAAELWYPSCECTLQWHYIYT